MNVVFQKGLDKILKMESEENLPDLILEARNFIYRNV